MKQQDQSLPNKVILPEKLRDVLITRTAIKTLQSETVVDKVISFQFKDANEAIKNCNEVEISGFGKFIASPTKMRKKIKKMELIVGRIESILQRTDLTEKEITSLDKKVLYNKLMIEYLKTKLAKYEN